jgi:transposase-like protein
VRIVEETYLPGMSVSLVARQHGSGSQTFNWRRLVAQGALTAAGAGEEVVPASHYRALQNQAAELQRLLSKRNGSRDTARGHVAGRRPKKTSLALHAATRGSAAAEALGISRQHLSAMHNRLAGRRRDRPPMPDAD